MSRAHDLTRALTAEARRLGFDLVGVCAAGEASGAAVLRQWVAAGRHASMHYMADRLDAYRHPAGVLPAVRSLLMLGVGYGTGENVGTAPHRLQGTVARYARSGVDYHDWVRTRLRKLVTLHRRLSPEAQVRGVVDTAPLLEREFAARARLGAAGKNTLLIHPRLGSWFFLAALLTSEKLDVGRASGPATPDDPCGACRACLDACPTGALIAPHGLDARRCLSYLTIEHRGAIPAELARKMGRRLFGCDTCQEVCPWNGRAEAAPAAEMAPRAAFCRLDAVELLALDEGTFAEKFRGTPFFRAGRSGLLRNAAIVLGNSLRDATNGSPAPASDDSQAASLPDRRRAVEALVRGSRDGDPVVRDACHWALAEIRGTSP